MPLLLAVDAALELAALELLAPPSVPSATPTFASSPSGHPASNATGTRPVTKATVASAGRIMDRA
jgi:hypothetical protein